MSFFQKDDSKKIPTTQVSFYQMGLAAQLREETGLSPEDRKILNQIVHSQEEGQDNPNWDLFIKNPYNEIDRHFHFDPDAQEKMIQIASKYAMIREDKRNFFLQTLARMQMHIQFDYILDALEENTLDARKKEMLHTLIPATSLPIFDPQNMAEKYELASQATLDPEEYRKAIRRYHAQVMEFERKIRSTYPILTDSEKEKIRRRRSDFIQRGVVDRKLTDSIKRFDDTGRLKNDGRTLFTVPIGDKLGRGLGMKFYSAPKATNVSESMAASGGMPNFDTLFDPAHQIQEREQEARPFPLNPLAQEFNLGGSLSA